MLNNTTTGLGADVRVLEGFGLSLVLLLSLVLNLSVCVIIWGTKVLRNKPTNTFVANLCIANLLLTTCVIPFSLATIVQNQHGSYSQSILCQGHGFISVVSGVAIVMSLCCISLDRYIAVTRPTRYRSIVTVKRACYALVVVWGQGLLYASFPFWGWSKYEYHEGTLHCSPKWTEDCSFYIYLAVVGFGIPISLMMFTYIRIFFVIRKQSRKVSTVRGAKVDLKKRESSGKSMQPQKRQSADPNLMEGRMGASVKKFSYSDEDETIFNSSIEPSSFDHGSARASTGKPPVLVVNQSKKCIISPEVASEDTCTDSLSPQQQSIRATMGKMFRRYFPIKPRGGNRRAISRENKVARTGVLLLIIFIILWLPYIVVHICSARLKAPQIVFRFSTWLVFLNGVLNPVAYAFGNARVKMKFEQTLCRIFALCCKCRQIEGEGASVRLSETI